MSSVESQDSEFPAIISILHVDDEVSILDLTRTFLENLSKGKLVVDSLEKPLEIFNKINEKNFDVIVCDYQMSDLTGIQLLEQLRENRIEIPFIMFTGRGREEVAIRALNLGAKRYIKKGGDIKSQFEELRHAIKEVVSYQRVQIELQEKNVSLEAINKISSRLHQLDDEKSVIKAAVESMMDYSGSPLAGIYKLEENSAYLDLVYSKGFDEKSLQVLRKMPLEGSLTGLSVKQKEVLWTSYVDRDNRADEESGKQLQRLDHRFAVSIPLINQNRVLGTLGLVFKEKKSFKEHERETFLAIGKTVALAMTNAKNISLIKESEEILRINEKYLKEAQTIAQIGHWRLDPLTQEITGSDELFRIFGLTKEESSLDKFVEVVHPDDREFDLYHIRRGMEYGEHWNIEHRLICPDGTTKYVHAKGEAITDITGKVLLLLGTVQDITERKQIENEIRKQKKFTDSVIDALTDTLYIFDPENGKVILWNKVFEEICGYSFEEISNNVPFDYYPPEEHQRIEEATKLISEKGRGILELTFITKNGKYIPFEYSAVLIKSPEGKSWICAIGRDISKRQKIISRTV
ncbi:MAG: PAS domain S-box protein [Candidatus Hodarchaeales archaeon]|jgi:PAS domain S-box-containing protein